MPVEMDPERFEALVDRGARRHPRRARRLVRNVVVLVEDEPPDDEPATCSGSTTASR